LGEIGENFMDGAYYEEDREYDWREAMFH
jgi:hypothetical protein